MGRYDSLVWAATHLSITGKLLQLPVLDFNTCFVRVSVVIGLGAVDLTSRWYRFGNQPAIGALQVIHYDTLQTLRITMLGCRACFLQAAPCSSSSADSVASVLGAVAMDRF